MKRVCRGVEFTLSNGIWQGACGEGKTFTSYVHDDGFGRWIWSVYRIHCSPKHDYFLEKVGWSANSLTAKEAIEASLDYIQRQPDYVPEKQTAIVDYV